MWILDLKPIIYMFYYQYGPSWDFVELNHFCQIDKSTVFFISIGVSSQAEISNTEFQSASLWFVGINHTPNGRAAGQLWVVSLGPLPCSAHSSSGPKSSTHCKT